MKDSTLTALEDYVYHGTPTGGFLYSVLTNDLFGAVGHADAQNSQDLVEICTYVYNKIPVGCWGSKAKVTKWLDRFRSDKKERSS